MTPVILPKAIFSLPLEAQAEFLERVGQTAKVAICRQSKDADSKFA